MKENKQAKLAVLIDADNTSPAAINDIMAEIAKLGLASAKRIYGDWSSHLLAGWKDTSLEYALTPVQQFAYTKGKDATDMQLIIDAMDLLHSGTFDGFCILSSDSDFTPLAMRIRENGLAVYGFGRETTPKAFRQACNRFFTIENLMETNPEDKTKVVAPAIERQPIEGELRCLLFKAIKDSTDETTGWAYVGQIGSYLNQTRPDFDSRTYGYAKLSSMLKELGGLQFKNSDFNRMYCRKIPYSELIKILDGAAKKFANKDGWTKISVLEKYVGARWDYRDFGFADFESLLETVHSIEFNQSNDSIRACP